MSGRTNVVPASLSYLTIYNPSLGGKNDEETLHDQILYYYSGTDKLRREDKPKAEGETDDNRKVMNERLRQIGLAQGMVEFAKSFAKGDAIDFIETEKSRIILHELEQGWWILASISLTRIVNFSETTPKTPTHPDLDSNIEYSAREVSPPALLLQNIVRAHQVFMLHHASSLSELYARLTRPVFCRALKRFWDNFLLDWNVLLNGNPAVDVFNGLKLAAGGELGVGVGEEEWGCGEREVLEGFVGRTDGLVDLMVSRFGDPPDLDPPSSTKPTPTSIGSGRDLRPSDGVVFSGVGAITKHSIKAISSWVEHLYKYGKKSYGIRDNPATIHHPRNRRPAEPERRKSAAKTHKNSQDVSSALSDKLDPPIGIPAPIIRVSTNSIAKNDYSKSPLTTSESKFAPDPSSGTESLMKYLTFGVYGSKWGIPAQKPTVHRNELAAASLSATSEFHASRDESRALGYFMIGLQGGLDQDTSIQYNYQDIEQGTNSSDASENQNWNNGIMFRTLQVERVRQKVAESGGSSILAKTGEEESISEGYYDRLNVVVYVRQPFIFTLLFELQTNSLAMPSFYHSLHHQLGPLQRPLLSSTSPSKASERLQEASAPKSTSSTESSQPIEYLVYDPFNLTVHSSIPNIPEPSNTTVAGSELGLVPWSRVEALNVHSQILNAYSSTRNRAWELERTCKTNRGWWVVWMRLPNATLMQHTQGNLYQEAFLIRKASDYIAPARKQASGIFSRGDRGSSSGGGWGGPGKLAEGIGIDAKRYIEGLLSLTR